MAVDAEQMDVAEDPDLLPEEKQFSLVGTKADGEMIVHSEIATITKWLLRHPAVEITSTRERDGSVVACTGRLPVGLVGMKAKPRSSDIFSRVPSSSVLKDRDGGGGG